MEGGDSNTCEDGTELQLLLDIDGGTTVRVRYGTGIRRAGKSVSKLLYCDEHHLLCNDPHTAIDTLDTAGFPGRVSEPHLPAICHGPKGGDARGTGSDDTIIDAREWRGGARQLPTL
jgi:hypothetical protein